MTRTVQPHYIRENKAARVPRRLIIIDSEAVSARARTGETQQWRCGAAIFVHWTDKGTLFRDLRTYTTPEDLWSDVAEFTRRKSRTVLYAHNLPYDMRITQALRWLPRKGFSLTAIRLASKGTWSKWSRDKATLTLCDSASLFPATLYTLGKMWGIPKLPLPDDDDTEGWVIRCVRDVEILAQTIVSYFEWLRTGVAGNWQVTGAGQAWAHWRHAHYTHHILVHCDDGATAAERRAMWTGRAENWQWGIDLTAPAYEWDWQNAYPRLARDNDIPIKMVATARRASMNDLKVMMGKWIVLADVTVTTDVPVVPAKHAGRILWPVGTFTTTLWQPELQLLLRSGATFTVERLWLYKGAPALAQWGEWILRELHTGDPDRPPWAGILLKHWSRALIGRFATQYQDWELLGRDPVERVLTGRMHDMRTGESSEFMQVGHEVHVMTGMTESDDSCPQVTSYVMSLARVQLWDAVTTAGHENVLYMDTDSIVVNAVGNRKMEIATRAGQFEGLRVKGRHRGYEIYGPRAAIIGGEAKLSGIPRNSRRTSQSQWTGEVWTQLEHALTIGESDRVTIHERKYTVRWNEFRRARTDNGRTVAYTLPGYEPSIPRGDIAPVTHAERVQYLRKHLGAKGFKHPVTAMDDVVPRNSGNAGDAHLAGA
jgi:hypothetical protein